MTSTWGRFLTCLRKLFGRLKTCPTALVSHINRTKPGLNQEPGLACGIISPTLGRQSYDDRLPSAHGSTTAVLADVLCSDSWLLMFTRFLTTLTIRAMSIAAALVMLTMLAFVTVFWFAITFTVRSMAGLWPVIAVRLVCLMKRHRLMNHRRPIASR